MSARQREAGHACSFIVSRFTAGDRQYPQHGVCCALVRACVRNRVSVSCGFTRGHKIAERVVYHPPGAMGSQWHSKGTVYLLRDSLDRRSSAKFVFSAAKAHLAGPPPLRDGTANASLVNRHGAPLAGSNPYRLGPNVPINLRGLGELPHRLFGRHVRFCDLFLPKRQLLRLMLFNF